MKREKRPVSNRTDPGYPTAEGAQVDRRRFLGLLGAGVTSLAAIAAGGSAFAQGFAPPPPGDWREAPPPLGMPRPPRYQRLRLPRGGARSVDLGGELYISYVLWVRHGDDEIGYHLERDEHRVLAVVDRLVSRELDAYALADPDTIWKAEKKIAGRLRRMLASHLRPALISVELEIIRRRIIGPIPGDVAPTPVY